MLKMSLKSLVWVVGWKEVFCFKLRNLGRGIGMDGKMMSFVLYFVGSICIIFIWGCIGWNYIKIWGLLVYRWEVSLWEYRYYLKMEWRLRGKDGV